MFVGEENRVHYFYGQLQYIYKVTLPPFGDHPETTTSWHSQSLVKLVGWTPQNRVFTTRKWERLEWLI
jgi:hypothetical protein